MTRMTTGRIAVNGILGTTVAALGHCTLIRSRSKPEHLAQRGVLAVYPVGGWWKENRKVDPARCETRFSLVAEIDADEQNVGLYAEVQQAIAASIEIQI
ncbi:MAG: hypothetical protein V7695_00270 [Sulfitobacter sp.]